VENFSFFYWLVRVSDCLNFRFISSKSQTGVTWTEIKLAIQIACSQHDIANNSIE
jgi:hypothetical protein